MHLPGNAVALNLTRRLNNPPRGRNVNRKKYLLKKIGPWLATIGANTLSVASNDPLGRGGWSTGSRAEVRQN